MAQVTNHYVIDNINKDYNSYAETAIYKPLVDLSNWAENKYGSNPMYIYGLTYLSEEDMDYLNSVRATDMSHMFDTCMALQEIDMSQWDTSKCTNMDYMFASCNSIRQYIGVENLNVQSLESMIKMFSQNLYLEELDLSNWNTKNLTYMGAAFYGMVTLTTINLSGSFNTSSVYDMNSLFEGCGALHTIIGSIDMSFAYPQYMFRQCGQLQNAHLKNVPNAMIEVGFYDNIGGDEVSLDDLIANGTVIVDNYI